jgi:hypothetical protein
VARRTDIQVRGLDQFRKELRQLEKSFGKELGQVNKRAAEVVATAARAKAVATGGVAAKAAPDIKTAAQQRAAKLVLDATRHGYAIGAFTGSKKYAQFKPWQGPEIEEGKGYAVGPAIVETEDEFLDVYGNALEDLARRAFPN